MEWISLEHEKPQHGEVVLAANPKVMAVCTVFIHGHACPSSCNHILGERSFYSLEVSAATLNGVTHFVRLRNPHEVLQ